MGSSLQRTWRRRRESSDQGLWTSRTEAMLDFMESNLLESDIICCQEFWFHPEFVERFQRRFGSRFGFYTVRRTGDKADGMVTLVRLDGKLHVAGHTQAGLGGTGDRIAQLLVLQPRAHAPPASSPVHHHAGGEDPMLRPAAGWVDEIRSLGGGGGDSSDELAKAPPLLLLNTHLSFPHTPVDEQAQRVQINTATTFLEYERTRRGLPPTTPQVVVGDLNSEDRSSVCQHLEQSGFTSCFADASPKGTANGSERRITHLNHLGQAVGVDHIFFKAPAHGADVLERVVDPPHLPCDTWQERMNSISDHRPLTASLRFSHAQPVGDGDGEEVHKQRSLADGDGERVHEQRSLAGALAPKPQPQRIKAR